MKLLRISRNFGKTGNSIILATMGIMLVLLFCSSLYAASDRPRAGKGVLFLRPAFPEQADEMKALQLYEAPGIDRINVIDVAILPSLAPSVSPPSGEYAVAVTGKKGDWFRLAYDDAGREGWLQARSFWDYLSWSDFLTGRFVSLLPDLRSSLTEVYLEPLATSPSIGRISFGQRMRILGIRDEWSLIQGDDGLKGWFRWCDSNGKLLIAVE